MLGSFSVSRSPSKRLIANNLQRSIGSITCMHLPGDGENILSIRQQLTAPPGGVDTSIDTTGRFMWPSALALLQHLPTDAIRNKKIIELGSGCGLLGMSLAAKDRASLVVLTDHPKAVDWLQGNIDLNQEKLLCDVSVAPLAWGDLDSVNEILHKYGPFDCIVRSDLLYVDHADQLKLIETLLHLSSPLTYLAYPKRGNDEVRFLKHAKERFDVDIQEIDYIGSGSSEKSTSTQPNKFGLAVLKPNDAC